MLYHFLYPLSIEWQIPLLNVFRYITFRSVWALLTALLLTIFIGPRFIQWLNRVRCGQYIQAEVACHMEKAGTPTMGGLLMGFSMLVSVLLWGDLTNVYVWLAMLVFIGFGLVGFLDDFAKLHHKTNQGLTARSKFAGQLLIAAVAMYLLLKEPAYSSVLSFPFFKDLQPDLGWLYIPFAMIVMVGSSNGVNLTDGMDGLAIGPTVVAGIVFAVFIYVAGHTQIAGYLQVPHVAGLGEVTVFCGALIGAGLGFLWFNAYPAQVFMGDVGSLSLGGVLGFLAVLCKQELIMLLAGGLFVLESLSVIVQVGYFRATGGKRFFRMAPLHHHFQLKGSHESKIVIRFWILSILFGLMALSALKIR